MRLSNQGRLRQQMRFLQRQFLQEGDLPFADVLSSKTVSQALTTAKVAKFFATIARAVGRQLEDHAEEQWLWKGRHVYMFDGSTISMPDTSSNQEAYT